MGLLLRALTACLLALMSSASAQQSFTAAQRRCSPLVDTGRLVDWSYSGFDAGREAGFPARPLVVADIKRDFGAKGDGVTDDSLAFERAGLTTFPKAGVIAVPAGRYRITRMLTFSTNAMFMGAGSEQSTLFFPQPLKDVVVSASYSYGPFYIEILNAYPLSESWTLGRIVEPIMKGSHRVCMSDVSGVSAGMTVNVVAKDLIRTQLQRLLHANASIDMGGTTLYGNRVRVFTTVLAVDAKAKCITVEHPMPINMGADGPLWMSLVQKFGPSTYQGLRGLSFEFTPSPYQGHFKETGKNAVVVKSLTNAYMKDLHFKNVDFGLYLADCSGVTVEGVRFSSLNAPVQGSYLGPSTGHYGIAVWQGTYNHIKDVILYTLFVHDVSVTDASIGTVYTNIVGENLDMDMHCGAPYASLFEDIHTGLGTRALRSSGDVSAGPHTGAYATFYNVRDATGVYIETMQGQLGAYMNFVGVDFARDRPGPLFPRLGWLYLNNNTDVAPQRLRDCLLAGRL